MSHEVELGPVGQQERDRVAAADAERGEAGGDPAHALGVLGPGQLDRAVGGPQRDLVGVALGGRLERLAHRGRVGRRLAGAGRSSVAVVIVPPSPFRSY